jgi:undecaprenyl pyrophosphate phosphatase UppP
VLQLALQAIRGADIVVIEMGNEVALLIGVPQGNALIPQLSRSSFATLIG